MGCESFRENKQPKKSLFCLTFYLEFISFKLTLTMLIQTYDH